MRFNTRQKIWLVLVVVVNAALWIIPSDVVANVARDQHTMLGRYSRTHFAWNLGVLLISLVSMYIDWSTGPTYKRRWFQVIAILIFAAPGVAAVDFLMRTRDTMHYIRQDGLYHRPPGSEFRITFNDRPNAFRTYPNAKPGYGSVDCIAHTDARGYRNPATYDRCDIVTLGDSFTEGSSISDEHAWPVRLTGLSGTQVCNLGMSGYDPFHYLESLRRVGLSFKPRVVICMLYEGNDFRSSSSDAKRRNPGPMKKVEEYVARSPLIKMVDQAIINTFAPIGANAPLAGGEIVDWLPLTVPSGPSGRHYAFEPKQLRDLLQNKQSFENDKHWLNPRQQITEMDQLCESNGAKFVLVLAPTKARVLLPLIADRLDPAKVRAFTAIDYKKKLPDTNEFLSELLTRADAKEQTIAEWCAKQSIPFFSPATALRSAVAEGTQVYYTFDQHWTPEGHRVFSQAMHQFLIDQNLIAKDILSARQP